MRSSILDLLRNAAGKFVSGEEIARKMRVSRTAVWKHIRELKQQGYAIDSLARSGYALRETPDLLFPEEIRRVIRSTVIGKEIHYEKEVTSTNSVAKRLAAKGAPEGTVVVSEAQSSGRGRLSRGWFSPAGKGIWFSVILRPNFLPQDAPKCTLMAATAITKAIERAANIRCGIKWPNDILYDGKKLVGILTEMNAQMDGIEYIVIGMGINVNLSPEDFPDDIQDKTTSLRIIRGEPVERLLLLAEILEQLEICYQEVLEMGFGGILEEWKTHSVTLGQCVSVIGIDRTFSGIAVDIDADGALLVEAEGRINRVLAGDVSIRPHIQ